MQNKSGGQIGRWNCGRRLKECGSSSRWCWGCTRCWYVNTVDVCGRIGGNFGRISICIWCSRLNKRKWQHKINSTKRKSIPQANINQNNSFFGIINWNVTVFIFIRLFTRWSYLNATTKMILKMFHTQIDNQLGKRFLLLEKKTFIGFSWKNCEFFSLYNT